MMLRPTQPATNWAANEYMVVVTVLGTVKVKTSGAEKSELKHVQRLKESL